jgi:hypothetical protein
MDSGGAGRHDHAGPRRLRGTGVLHNLIQVAGPPDTGLRSIYTSVAVVLIVMKRTQNLPLECNPSGR